MSWSLGGESSSETSDDSTYFTTPSGHEGMTFVASTGDDGTTVSGASPAVNYPAASPNVLAAGGSSLTLNGDSYVQRVRLDQRRRRSKSVRK